MTHTFNNQPNLSPEQASESSIVEPPRPAADPGSRRPSRDASLAATFCQFLKGIENDPSLVHPSVNAANLLELLCEFLIASRQAPDEETRMIRVTQLITKIHYV